MAEFARALEARKNNRRSAGGDGILVQPAAANVVKQGRVSSQASGDAVFRSGTGTRGAFSQHSGVGVGRKRTGLADRVFQPGEHAAGARGGPSKRDRSSTRTGRQSNAPDPAVTD